MQALLSPLEYAHVDDWRRTVNDRMRALLGADMASFLLTVEGARRLYSCELPHYAEEFPDLVDPLDKKFDVWRRHVELGVCNRETLWRPFRDRYYRSSYYNDFVVPMRSFDYVGMSIPLNGTPSGSSVASLLFHHERETGPKFGERGLSLLRIAFPAFKAGVRTLARLQQHRTSFLGAIDSLGTAVAVFDFSGRLIHRNVALASLLAEDPEGAMIVGRASRMARACVDVRVHLWGSFRDGYPSPPVTVVSTRKMRYRLSGSYIGAREVGADTYVLVTVEPSRPLLPRLDALRERFEFTKREAEVALLLARRKRNREIAEALCISERTARHHTEKVLLKLGIGSRDQVAEAIQHSAH